MTFSYRTQARCGLERAVTWDLLSDRGRNWAVHRHAGEGSVSEGLSLKNSHLLLILLSFPRAMLRVEETKTRTQRRVTDEQQTEVPSGVYRRVSRRGRVRPGAIDANRARAGRPHRQRARRGDHPVGPGVAVVRRPGRPGFPHRG